ncbi:putative nucleolar complex protein 2 [Monocercomonoides exilis]|uniref:putative nucleolar complex protein 2 n=1 Tax=Monocercomonoides exilis TaxID=2049356 RepID=UPI00355ABBAD|nr:putative nucleolar complex protein 2 [Monocercomonoides exilis]|eukprot:MONOS_228.1-p1 / transcript=MONOS_228.1 / gene=MONOS_228 / organism=Monocercomonoides_exilis_PA203 / gene_product=unspecified product / transcript_product=unspecified product / location=Mono_scaffold00004:37604-40441(-) / protein_length=786 / sequence_SO=supercontig / SO=protein_coding / is_pseudo=false
MVNCLYIWDDHNFGIAPKALLHNLTYYRKALDSITSDLEEDGDKEKQTMSAQKFDTIMSYFMGEFIVTLRNIFKIPDKGLLSRSSIPKNNPKWDNYRACVKKYTLSTLHMLLHFKGVGNEMVAYIYAQQYQFVPFIASLEFSLRIRIIRVAIDFLCCDHTDTQQNAFLFLHRLGMLHSPSLDAILKPTFAKVTGTFSSPFPSVFLQNSLVELFSINMTESYRALFILLRDMSKSLKEALANTKDSATAKKTLMSWKHINRMKQIGQILTHSPSSHDTLLRPDTSTSSASSSSYLVLQPLLYPYIEICIGTASLFGGFSLSAVRLKYISMVLSVVEGSLPIYQQMESENKSEQAQSGKKKKKQKKSVASDEKTPAASYLPLLAPVSQLILDILSAHELQEMPHQARQSKKTSRGSLGSNLNSFVPQRSPTTTMTLLRVMGADSMTKKSKEFQTAVVTECVQCLYQLLSLHAGSVSYPEYAQVILSYLSRIVRRITLSEHRQMIKAFEVIATNNAEWMCRVRSEARVTPADIDKCNELAVSLMSITLDLEKQPPLLRFWRQRRAEVAKKLKKLEEGEREAESEKEKEKTEKKEKGDSEEKIDEEENDDEDDDDDDDDETYLKPRKRKNDDDSDEDISEEYDEEDEEEEEEDDDDDEVEGFSDEDSNDIEGNESASEISSNSEDESSSDEVVKLELPNDEEFNEAVREQKLEKQKEVLREEKLKEKKREAIIRRKKDALKKQKDDKRGGNKSKGKSVKGRNGKKKGSIHKGEKKLASFRRNKYKRDKKH